MVQNTPTGTTVDQGVDNTLNTLDHKIASAADSQKARDAAGVAVKAFDKLQSGQDVPELSGVKANIAKLADKEGKHTFSGLTAAAAANELGVSPMWSTIIGGVGAATNNFGIFDGETGQAIGGAIQLTAAFKMAADLAAKAGVPGMGTVAHAIPATMIMLGIAAAAYHFLKPAIDPMLEKARDKVASYSLGHPDHAPAT